MPKFYTPTFAAPVVSLDAARATPRDLVPHEKAMQAHDGHLAVELEAARAENARLKAVAATAAVAKYQAAVKADLDRAPINAPVPHVDTTIDDSVTAFQKAQIDAMVALMVEEGVVAYDAATDQYVRPRSAVWCFNGPRPWALD